MRNIFKENKKLKEENNKLKIKINELQKEKFNFGVYFSFPYRLTDKEILQHILNGIQLKVYEEVFKRGE